MLEYCVCSLLHWPEWPEKIQFSVHRLPIRLASSFAVLKLSNEPVKIEVCSKVFLWYFLTIITVTYSLSRTSSDASVPTEIHVQMKRKLKLFILLKWYDGDGCWASAVGVRHLPSLCFGMFFGSLQTRHVKHLLGYLKDQSHWHGPYEACPWKQLCVSWWGKTITATEPEERESSGCREMKPEQHT